MPPYFDNDSDKLYQCGCLTGSHSFGTNLTHYEMKSHSSDAADLKRSDKGLFKQICVQFELEFCKAGK